MSHFSFSSMLPLVPALALCFSWTGTLAASERDSADVAVEEGGWLDIRLTARTLPRSRVEVSTGSLVLNSVSSSHRFDSGFGLSLMAVGPACYFSVLGCDEGRSASSPSTTYNYRRIGSGPGNPGPADPVSGIFSGAAIITGLEVSYNQWEKDSRPNVVVAQQGDGSLRGFLTESPSIDVTAVPVTLHLGLAMGSDVFGGNMHAEIGGFVGIGMMAMDYRGSTTLLGQVMMWDTSTDDIFWEYGARAGLYYTIPLGLQLGLDVRHQNTRASLNRADPFGFETRVDAGVRGLTAGLSLGWRF